MIKIKRTTQEKMEILKFIETERAKGAPLRPLLEQFQLHHRTYRLWKELFCEPTESEPKRYERSFKSTSARLVAREGVTTLQGSAFEKSIYLRGCE